MTQDELKIETKTLDHADACAFILTGSLDVATSSALKRDLAKAAEDRRRYVIVDLTKVDFLDSTGLGALMGAHRRAAESGGGVSLVVTDGPILRLLNITGLSRVFSLYESLDDAIARVGGVE